MIKFKKQVGKHKITHFLKATPLILFFNCVDNDDFYKILANSGILKNSDTLSGNTKKDSNIDEWIALQSLIIKSIKNNYAKKVVVEKTSLKKNDFMQSLSENQDNPVQQRNNSKSRKIKIDINTLSIFQGKNILMGFRDIKSLALLKDFIENKNVNLLAGIYRDNIIDHNQIKHLARICQGKQVYMSLINLLNTCKNQKLYNLSKNLDFSYLLYSSNNLITLSKTHNALLINHNKI